MQRYEYYAGRAARRRSNYIQRRLINAAAFIIAALIFLIPIWRVMQESPTASAAEYKQTLMIERSVYYPNCAAARAAGKAPIDEGQPGYRGGLDADDDGVACEPYP
jgi:hypothetical protein